MNGFEALQVAGAQITLKIGPAIAACTPGFAFATSAMVALIQKQGKR